MSTISKQISECDKIMKRAEREKTRKRNACPHQKKGGFGDPCIIGVTREGTNQNAYKCTECGEIISMTVPSIEEFNESVAKIRTGLNYVKMLVNLNSGKGTELLDEVRKFLDKSDDIRKLYKEYHDNASQKRKDKKSHKGSHSSANRYEA